MNRMTSSTPGLRAMLKMRFVTHYRRMAHGISRNVRILLPTEPLWAIPVAWIRTYASLFMEQLGLNAVQIGWLASLTLITQMLVAPFGGYVADRFGRKRTLIVFDIFSWVLPTILWMLARNVWFFVAAAILNGINIIIWPSWSCLLVEDTRPDRRPIVFAGFQLVVLGAGLFSPIAGWIVDRYGVILGCRIIYAVAFTTITIMTFVRGLLTRETSVGAAMVNELRGARLRDSLAGYREIYAEGFKNPTLILLFFLVVINFGYQAIWTTYSILYMTHPKGLALSPGLAAAWPTFSSLVMIATLVLLVPRIHVEKLPHWLIFSSGMLCVGTLLFILTPANSYILLALSATLIGIGTVLVNPVRDAFIANVLEDRHRATLLAGMNSLSMIAIVPLTPLAGRIFEVNPRAPLALLFLILSAGVFISLALRRVSVTAHKAEAE
ncbi:MAG: MFS transporter [Firmicutes bacterium]|nr:MFS transporter [Bacillota bacterium]